MQLVKDQLSLKLWEPLCADNPNPSGPPLLLLPPEYEFLDPENGPRELAELMYIGMRVRGASPSPPRLFICDMSLPPAHSCSAHARDAATGHTAGSLHRRLFPAFGAAGGARVQSAANSWRDTACSSQSSVIGALQCDSVGV